MDSIKPKQRRPDFKRNNKIRRSLLIFDKLTFVLPMQGYEDVMSTINALHRLKTNKQVSVEVQQDRSDFIVLALSRGQQGRWPERAYVHIIASAGRNYLSIQYNPSKANEAVYQFLDMVVQNVTNTGSWIGFCATAHISRLDVCYDMKGMDIRKHAFAVKRFKKSRSWPDLDVVIDGEHQHQSLACGTRGKNSAGIYDKVKEDPTMYPEERYVTRIEWRFKPKARNMRLVDLLDIKNPFPRVLVFGASLIDAPSMPKGFLAVWQRQGFRKALNIRKVRKETADAILKEAEGARLRFWHVNPDNNQSWQDDVRAGLEACGLLELINEVKRHIETGRAAAQKDAA